jgi:hypothetical protein
MRFCGFTRMMGRVKRMRMSAVSVMGCGLMVTLQFLVHAVPIAQNANMEPKALFFSTRRRSKARQA